MSAAIIEILGAAGLSYTGVASPPTSPDPELPAVALRQYQDQVDTDYRLFETAIHTAGSSTPAVGCTGP